MEKSIHFVSMQFSCQSPTFAALKISWETLNRLSLWGIFANQGRSICFSIISLIVGTVIVCSSSIAQSYNLFDYLYYYDP